MLIIAFGWPDFWWLSVHYFPSRAKQITITASIEKDSSRCSLPDGLQFVRLSLCQWNIPYGTGILKYWLHHTCVDSEYVTGSNSSCLEKGQEVEKRRMLAPEVVDMWVPAQVCRQHATEQFELVAVIDRIFSESHHFTPLGHPKSLYPQVVNNQTK